MIRTILNYPDGVDIDEKRHLNGQDGRKPPAPFFRPVNFLMTIEHDRDGLSGFAFFVQS